jgi:hypothetical protein
MAMGITAFDGLEKYHMTGEHMHITNLCLVTIKMAGTF